MKKFLQCLIVFFINYSIMLGQNLPIENYNSQKNLTTNQDLSRGRIALTLPLFNIPINGINISSSLNYFSDSNNYYTESSIVGNNWSLSTIGRIDIIYDNVSENAFNGSNYFNEKIVNYSSCILDSKYLDKNIEKSDLLKNNSLITSKYHPKKFNFEILGEKGYFYLDNHGEPIFSNNSKFKVRFENNSCNNINSPITNLLKIILIDKNGNQFHFGGTYGSTNISYDYSNRSTITYLEEGGSYKDEFYFRNNHISSLNLTKIILANDELVEVKYKEPINNTFNNTFVSNNNKTSKFDFNTINSNELTNDNFFLQTIPGYFFLDIKNFPYHGYSSPAGYVSSIENSRAYSSMTNLSVIDYINISNKAKIVFKYDNYDISSIFFNKKTINSILILDNFDNKISKIELNYKRVELPKNYHKISLLEKILINNNLHTFEYYDRYNDNLSLNEAGLIKKIIFPNNGFKEFIYEPHQTNSTSIITHGGYRINKILTYNNINPNPIDEEIYTYLNDNGTTSGYFDNPFKNMQIQNFNSIPFITNKNKIYSSVLNSLGNSVSYNQVQVKNTYGFTKYYLSDKSLNNDISNNTNNTNNTLDYDGFYYDTQGFYEKYKIDNSEKRGIPFKIFIYDTSNNLVKKIENNYYNFYSERNPLSLKNCTNCKYQDSNYFLAINKKLIAYVPIVPSLISDSKITEYLDNGKTLTTEKKYIYNDTPFYWHPLPVKEETTSNGSTVTNETLYNYDLLRKANCGTNCNDNTSVGGKLGTYKTMADNNVLAPVVGISTNQNNKKFLTENIYQKNPLNQNQFNVTSNKVSLLNASIDPNNLANVSTVAVKENQLFDDKGNLLQFNEKGGSPTTIIYGYNQSLPIAEVKGATYAQVMSAFGLSQDAKAYLNLDIVKKSNLDKDDATEATLISALNTFKNNANLSNYLIVTKTYNPLIGISSESTPTGQRTYYQYDENNQLVKILDHQKNILQEFKYNYAKRKYYNEALTINLYKNDCSEGLFTNPIIHVIPSNKYVSYISINDANEIAKKEEEKLNQDYANKNGTCTSFTCKFNQGEFIYDFDYSIEKTSIMNEVRLQIGFLLTLTDLKNYDWSKEVKIGRLTGSCVPLKNQYFKFNFGETLIIGYIDREGNIIINSIKLRAQNFYPLDIKYNR